MRKSLIKLLSISTIALSSLLSSCSCNGVEEPNNEDDEPSIVCQQLSEDEWIQACETNKTLSFTRIETETIECKDLNYSVSSTYTTAEDVTNRIVYKKNVEYKNGELEKDYENYSHYPYDVCYSAEYNKDNKNGENDFKLSWRALGWEYTRGFGLGDLSYYLNTNAVYTEKGYVFFETYNEGVYSIKATTTCLFSDNKLISVTEVMEGAGFEVEDIGDHFATIKTVTKYKDLGTTSLELPAPKDIPHDFFPNEDFNDAFKCTEFATQAEFNAAISSCSSKGVTMITDDYIANGTKEGVHYSSTTTLDRFSVPISFYYPSFRYTSMGYISYICGSGYMQKIIVKFLGQKIASIIMITEGYNIEGLNGEYGLEMKVLQFYDWVE